MKGKDQAKILAKGVYTALTSKNEKQSQLVVANFLAYLKEHRLVVMVPDILAELETLYFTEKGIVRTSIFSKDKLSQAVVNNIIALVKKKTNQQVEIKEKTDQTLLGGAVIRYADKVIDLSLKNQLIKLQKQLNN